MGEQPNPWDLLQPQDATSRHRGAKPCRRFELLGKISLLSPGSFYPLSHMPSTRSCGITKPDFRPCSACPPCSQAPFCLSTLCGWFPFTLREPLGASVTLWEATAPVKLPAWPCPRFLPCEKQNTSRVVFHRCLPHPQKDEFSGSHLSYARCPSFPDQGVVKLHGVFLSCRG